MLANFSREYNINRLLLSSSGLWPFQNRFARISLQTISFLVLISYSPFQILLLYDYWGNGQMVFEGCFQIANWAAFFVRIVNSFVHYDKLQQLYETMDEHWNIFTNEIEVQILKDYSVLSRNFTKYYLTIMYSGVISGFIVVPLIPVFLDIVLPVNESRARFLAIEIDEYRLNKDEYFLLFFCYTNSVIVMGINIVVGVDAMHITCTAHACSLFAAVSKHIESLVLKINKSSKMRESGYYMSMTFDTSNEELIYREYITCLKKHQIAIDFVDLLDSTYQGLSLFILISGTGIFTLTSIRMVYVLDQLNWQEMAKFIFIIMGALLTLFIGCYSGQILMDESQNVFSQAYATKWYDFSPRLKSLLIIILYRSNVPCELKAGNIVPLSIMTYAGVVRMGVSYLTAFLSLKN
ncbi:uncharacterized protein [Anoplolepis gracilipes]|uniref:uncharacterized protein n=1 Tax=Anoplolepis gracilipes TaxID=354296 RepID=UPI003BA38FF2